MLNSGFTYFFLFWHTGTVVYCMNTVFLYLDKFMSVMSTRTSNWWCWLWRI